MLALLHRLFTGSRFAGLEAEFRSGGPVFHLTILKQERDKVVVEKCAFNITDTAELIAAIPEGTPAALAITGKVVVHRVAEATADQSDQAVLKKILPGASPGEFLMTRIFLNEQQQCIGLTRKQEAEQLIQKLAGISIVASAVGVGIIKSVLPLLTGYAPELKCGHHIISFESGQMAGITFDQHLQSQKEFVLSGDTLPAYNMVSFALALTGLVDEKNEAGYLAINDIKKQEHSARRKVKLAIAGGLVVMFIVLLTNFLMFSHYRSVKLQLESEVSGLAVSVSDLRTLETEVNNKAAFFSASGIDQRYSFAWIADRLAAEIPGGIVLDRMNFSPRQKFSEEDTIGFTQRKLMITGQAAESILLNNWLRTTQSKDWIDSVQLVNYTSSGMKPDGRFEIELAMK